MANFRHKPHYNLNLRLNERSQRRKDRKIGARGRRAMSAKLIRYDQLRTLMRERAGQAERPAQTSLPNCESALAAFLRERGLADDEVVGETLRSSFNAVLSEHKEALRAQTRSKRFIENRAWALRHWYRLVRAIDHEGATLDGGVPPLAAALREVFSDRTRNMTHVARAASVSWETLRRWTDGNMPRRGMEDSLHRIERVCFLEPGALTDLLPWRPSRHLDAKKGVPLDELGQKNAELTQSRYRLHGDRIPAILRREWREYLSARTGIKDRPPETPEPKKAVNRFTAAMARSESTLGKRLRVREPAPGEVKGEKTLHLIDGKYCTTASAYWEHIISFLGWAAKSKEGGGAGYPLDELSLGLFANYDMLNSFLEWKCARTDSINFGTKNFISFAMGLLNSDTGFLVRRPDIGTCVGVPDAEAWREQCLQTRRMLSIMLDNVLPNVRKRCDPEKRLKKILALPSPMDAFVEGVKRLISSNPRTGGINEALWARNVLLLALPISNPLRLKNLQLLTYRDDNSGKLRKTSTGWRIFIDRSEFKNIHGAAKNRDYDQAIDPSIWPYIERYIKHYRPLFNSHTDFLFVSQETPDFIWSSMDDTYRDLTKEYVPGCEQGTGTHGIRHVCGTHVLVVSGGDILQAAELLHDKISTVERDYIHILGSIADRGRTATLSPVLRGLPKLLGPAQAAILP